MVAGVVEVCLELLGAALLWLAGALDWFMSELLLLVLGVALDVED